VLFRDDRIEGDNVRIAYAFIPVREGLPPAVVQVAETLKKREALSGSIISGVLLPQFAIIPLAVILVYMGLSRGIAPLRLLQQRIHRRRPTDLSPIPVTRVPDEVRPLVVAFNQMMERLEENLQAQQRFIAQAAHQMRTPLTGLKTQTEIALSETDPAQMRHALRLIAESTDRASHMINQLLILARAESSHEKLHQVVPVDLDALAREVTDGVGDAGPGQGHRPRLRGTSGAIRLLIDGVPLLLRELLTNLVDNAIKYTPARRPCHGAVPRHRIGHHRSRGRRYWHRPGGARKRLRTLLPGARHRCGRQRPGPADRRRNRRVAPRKNRTADGPEGRGCLFRLSFFAAQRNPSRANPQRPRGQFPISGCKDFVSFQSGRLVDNRTILGQLALVDLSPSVLPGSLGGCVTQGNPARILDAADIRSPPQGQNRRSARCNSRRSTRSIGRLTCA
jgi:hypothetical protein